MQSSTIVIVVAAIYFVSMIIIGIGCSRFNKNTSDFLVAGRKLGVIMTSYTMAAVQIGVGVVLSSATKGYSGGVWYGTYYALGCGGGLIFAGLVAVKKLRAKESYVPIDFYAQRFGDSKAVRFWAWLSNVPSMLGIFVAQMLAAGSILAGFGIPFYWGVVICTLVILIYCALGGMMGVVITDVVQTTIIMIGIPILFIATAIKYTAAGGSMGAIISVPFIAKGMFTQFVYLVIPFLFSISVSYDAYSRIQSAKDAKTASSGCIIGGVIVIIIGFLCSCVGVMALKLFPGVTDGIFAITTTGVLPPVLAGIVIAAILSAAMSSANCVILSLGASFARDFYNKFLHPEVENLDELPKSKQVSRWTVIIASLVGILIAFKMTDILDAMIIFNYPYMGSMLVPLLGGLLWDGATKKGAIAAMITGGIIGVVSFLFGIPGPLNGVMNTDLALMIAYSVSAVVFIAVSLADKNSAKATA